MGTSVTEAVGAGDRETIAAAPLLGQDNQAIYCDELGLDEQEVEVLRASGVI